MDDTPETLPYRVKAQAILWRHAGQIVRARQALAKQKLPNRPVWEAFFRNEKPPQVRTSWKPEPACPDLSEIAERSGYGSSSLWSKMTVLKGFGKMPGDSYDLSVEVAETGNALAARVRSHEVSLRVLVPKQLSETEREALRQFSRQTPPAVELGGTPIAYRVYDNPSCRFVLGMRDQAVTELLLLNYGQ